MFSEHHVQLNLSFIKVKFYLEENCKTENTIPLKFDFLHRIYKQIRHDKSGSHGGRGRQLQKCISFFVQFSVKINSGYVFIMFNFVCERKYQLFRVFFGRYVIYVVYQKCHIHKFVPLNFVYGKFKRICLTKYSNCPN